MSTFNATSLLTALTASPLVIAHVPGYISMPDVTSVISDARVLDLSDDSVRDAVDWDPLAFLEGPARHVVFTHSHLLPRLPAALSEALHPTSQPGRCVLLSAVSPHALPGAAHLPTFAHHVSLRAVTLSGQPDAPGLPAVLTHEADPPSVRCEVARTEYANALVSGGTPDAMRLDDVHRAAWWDAAGANLVEAARSVIKVGGPERLHQLLEQVALRPGAELVRAQLGAATGLPASSVTLYMNALVAAGAVELIPAWTPGITSREVVKPAAYPCDTAAAVIRAGTTRDELLTVSPASPLRGLLLTAVVAELLTRKSTHTPYELRHYRDRAGVAVPLIIELPDSSVVAIDVAATSSPREEAFTALRTLRSLLGERLRRGVLLTVQQQGRRVEDNVWSLPAAALWQIG